MTDDKELERLAEPSYWDTRYAETQPGKQLHEWFRSYGDLEPFLAHYLFQLYPAKSRPRILHLGSGDSVSAEYSNQLEFRHLSQSYIACGYVSISSLGVAR
jgi:hypothetical protein